jgi:protein TonB
MEDDQSKAQIQTYTPPPPPKQVEEEEEEIFVVVENQPEFPGGQAAMMKFLSENIKYPVIAQENGIQGRVICNFVVERDGSITDVQVVRGVDPSLDKEAVRVIQSMPKWKPGMQRGKPVRVRFTLPVVFRLQQ